MGLFGKSKKELLEWQNLIISNPQNRLRMTEKELKLLSQNIAENHLRIANDCVNLVNTTKKADVYFSRYNLLLEHGNFLAKLSKFVAFRGEQPADALNRIVSQKSLLERALIDRCVEDVRNLKTESAKAKRYQKLLIEFLPFCGQMDKTNWDYLEELCTNGAASYINEKRTGNNPTIGSLFDEINQLLMQVQTYMEIKYSLLINPYYTDPARTGFEKQRLTPSGKVPKYPTVFSYALPDIGGYEKFGKVWLLADGSIGKADLNSWCNRVGYFVHLAILDGSLIVSKIETVDYNAGDIDRTTIYQA